MTKSLFKAPIDLKKHSSLLYAEGVFGLGARKKYSMRPKTADGILRYAEYAIVGVVDSGSYEKTAGEVLPVYLHGVSPRLRRAETPIFHSLKEAKAKTDGTVLILGSAPEGGELPEEWRADIRWAIKNRMHIVSGLHFLLGEDPEFQKVAKKYRVILWDVRKTSSQDHVPVGSSKAYFIKKPIVLTVGTDAAIGKMTVAYEMHRAAKELGAKSCLIPTGQTAIMIEGWGVSIDALPADFMAGAAEMMIREKAKNHDILFVEGQGSLFHPAYANTTIALLHGAVPSHMVLVHKPSRKHSIGSRLIVLPDFKKAISHYENSVLPEFRKAKVAGIAFNFDGFPKERITSYMKEVGAGCRLPVFDALEDKKVIHQLVRNILDGKE